VNADGSDPHLITDLAPSGHYPSWSPDGSRIAFADQDGVKVVAPDGSGLRPLLISDRDRPGMYYEIDWSPDGSRLLLTCVRDICVVDSEGTGLENLTAGRENTYERGADWSPDGNAIVFSSDRAGTTRLYVMDADGMNIRELETDPRLEGCCPDPDW
jgi:Tol biopolymer transport system component